MRLYSSVVGLPQNHDRPLPRAALSPEALFEPLAVPTAVAPVQLVPVVSLQRSSRNVKFGADAPDAFVTVIV